MKGSLTEFESVSDVSGTGGIEGFFGSEAECNHKFSRAGVRACVTCIELLQFLQKNGFTRRVFFLLFYLFFARKPLFLYAFVHDRESRYNIASTVHF